MLKGLKLSSRSQKQESKTKKSLKYGSVINDSNAANNTKSLKTSTNSLRDIQDTIVSKNSQSSNSSGYMEMYQMRISRMTDYPQLNFKTAEVKGGKTSRDFEVDPSMVICALRREIDLECEDDYTPVPDHLVLPRRREFEWRYRKLPSKSSTDSVVGGKIDPRQAYYENLKNIRPLKQSSGSSVSSDNKSVASSVSSSSRLSADKMSSESSIQVVISDMSARVVESTSGSKASIDKQSNPAVIQNTHSNTDYTDENETPNHCKKERLFKIVVTPSFAKSTQSLQEKTDQSKDDKISADDKPIESNKSSSTKSDSLEDVKVCDHADQVAYQVDRNENEVNKFDMVFAAELPQRNECDADSLISSGSNHAINAPISSDELKSSDGSKELQGLNATVPSIHIESIKNTVQGLNQGFESVAETSTQDQGYTDAFLSSERKMSTADRGKCVIEWSYSPRSPIFRESGVGPKFKDVNSLTPEEYGDNRNDQQSNVLQRCDESSIRKDERVSHMHSSCKCDSSCADSYSSESNGKAVKIILDTDLTPDYYYYYSPGTSPVNMKSSLKSSKSKPENRADENLSDKSNVNFESIATSPMKIKKQNTIISQSIQDENTKEVKTAHVQLHNSTYYSPEPKESGKLASASKKKTRLRPRKKVKKIDSADFVPLLDDTKSNHSKKERSVKLNEDEEDSHDEVMQSGNNVNTNDKNDSKPECDSCLRSESNNGVDLKSVHISSHDQNNNDINRELHKIHNEKECDLKGKGHQDNDSYKTEKKVDLDKDLPINLCIDVPADRKRVRKVKKVKRRAVGLMDAGTQFMLLPLPEMELEPPSGVEDKQEAVIQTNANLCTQTSDVDGYERYDSCLGPLKSVGVATDIDHNKKLCMSAANKTNDVYVHQVLFDEYGNQVPVDEYGKQLCFDGNGKCTSASKKNSQLLFDEYGNRVYFDEEGNRVLFDKHGYRIVFDKFGSQKFFDKLGNRIFFDPFGHVIVRSDNDSCKSGGVLHKEAFTDPSDNPMNTFRGVQTLGIQSAVLFSNKEKIHNSCINTESSLSNKKKIYVNKCTGPRRDVASGNDYPITFEYALLEEKPTVDRSINTDPILNVNISTNTDKYIPSNANIITPILSDSTNNSRPDDNLMDSHNTNHSSREHVSSNNSPHTNSDISIHTENSLRERLTPLPRINESTSDNQGRGKVNDVRNFQKHVSVDTKSSFPKEDVEATGSISELMDANISFYMSSPIRCNLENKLSDIGAGVFGIATPDYDSNSIVFPRVSTLHEPKTGDDLNNADLSIEHMSKTQIGPSEMILSPNSPILAGQIDSLEEEEESYVYSPSVNSGIRRSVSSVDDHSKKVDVCEFCETGSPVGLSRGKMRRMKRNTRRVHSKSCGIYRRKRLSDVMYSSVLDEDTRDYQNSKTRTMDHSSNVQIVIYDEKYENIPHKQTGDIPISSQNSDEYTIQSARLLAFGPLMINRKN